MMSTIKLFSGSLLRAGPREASSSSGGNVIGNLQGKCITEKDFPGVILHDASIVQLTTAFHILAFISDNSAVSAALYDEGAVIIIQAVFINCKVLLERSSKICDYLVVSDSFSQEAKEQHKNTKLINSLLQLHREVSPSLTACAFDLSYPYPDALGFGAVCHLIASAVACWPVYGWTAGLFHFLLDNLHNFLSGTWS